MTGWLKQKDNDCSGIMGFVEHLPLQDDIYMLLERCQTFNNWRSVIIHEKIIAVPANFSSS